MTNTAGHESATTASDGLWPWSPDALIDAADALWGKVETYCGDSESYIGSYDREALAEPLAELLTLAEAVRDLIPELFVTPVATDEARHEVECPSCGSTIRARMADAPTALDPVYLAQERGEAP